MSSSTSIERRETPPADGANPSRLRTILIAVALAGLYLLSLWFNITEAGRRSVNLDTPAPGADHLIMDINVVHVDLLRAEMTTRISFHLAGKLAQDEVKPATDLKLVLNTIKDQQEFTFAEGERINPIEAVFPLKGEVNLYPFDHHTGTLWFFLTIPEKPKVKPKPITVPKTKAKPKEPEKRRGLFSFLKKQKPVSVPEKVIESPSLPVGTMALETQVQADTETHFTASVSGLTFRGSNFVESAQNLRGLTGIQVDLRRSLTVIIISVTSMLMMAALAVGLVAMVLRIVGGSRRLANFHVPMSVSLIFGLPALRNIQPGIPPIGTLGDSVSFIWAEVAAAGAAVALVIHWMLHRSSSTPPTGPSQR